MLAPVALYLLVALLSYHSGDAGWSSRGGSDQTLNLGGVFGAWISDVLLTLFGWMAYLFPVLLAWIGWQVFRGWDRIEGDLAEPMVRGVGFLLFLGTGSGLLFLHAEPSTMLPHGGGGILGDLLVSGLLGPFGFLGVTLFFLALWFAGVTLMTGVSWLQIMDLVGRWTLDSVDLARDAVINVRERQMGRQARDEREVVRRTDREKKSHRKPPEIASMSDPFQPSTRAEKERQQPLFESLPAGDLPPLSLLDQPTNTARGYSEETLEALSRQVELKLADFNIEVEVVAVHPGPVITRFELQPAPGIKGSQIINLAKDIARGLSVISVRVVDVIPGKSVIGLEIPNVNRELVYLSEILRSDIYDNSKSVLTLALGKDISGKPVVVDLAKMPHLLVAGTTGSGKSVGLNAMIMSLLYKATPEEVRLIMVDPKMLELSVYEKIPHLLTPVVTDMKDAANALRWCVGEMERRYQVMSALGVRNLAGYNRKVRDGINRGEPLKDPLMVQADLGDFEEPFDLEYMPSIVVVIDEFADLMMIVGKKIEELIARLAQKARAAGIHLILATQRPSVDVITGLIKANIPTRIAFQVSSKVDSRTILDQMGAEQLLGHGDMLYLPPGTALPERIHGAYVADEEVHAAVKYLKTHTDPDYNEDVLNETHTLITGQTIGETGLPVDQDGEQDVLYDQAVDIVIRSRRASISNLQRRLKVGYNRAARMIEEMENAGLISAPEHNGNREVLVPEPEPE